MDDITKMNDINIYSLNEHQNTTHIEPYKIENNDDKYNDIDMKYIFTLIKKHKLEELIDIFRKKINLEIDIDIDLNIRDDTNNYIISYIVIYNRLDILKLVYKLGAKIDILDSENRPILYYPIKYGYDDILDYLLEINKNNIGVNIIDIKDKKQKIPLHYAIIYKNLYAVKKLLEHESNPNILDSNGYNALHLSIFSRNIEIFKLILQYITNINLRCNTGETALHLASNLNQIEMAQILVDNNINLDIQDNQHEFTVLHYSVSLNQQNLTKIILDKMNNPNLQDIFGNTPLHYSIIENNIGILELFLEDKYKTKINFNLWNIDGKIPLHILLENYNENNIYIIEKVIEKSNISLRDNLGNSCLLYIINLNIWKDYKHLLINKKLDIFVKNRLNILLIDLIDKKDKEEFLNLVIDSYMNRLNQRPDGWKNEWENICSKINNNIQQNNNSCGEGQGCSMPNNSTKVTKIEKTCRENIRQHLDDVLQLIKENKRLCTDQSYPVNRNKICLNISEGQNLNFCSFTGNNLDVLFGLIYLLNKHKIATSTIILDYIDNKQLYTFYK